MKLQEQLYSFDQIKEIVAETFSPELFIHVFYWIKPEFVKDLRHVLLTKWYQSVTVKDWHRDANLKIQELKYANCQCCPKPPNAPGEISFEIREEEEGLTQNQVLEKRDREQMNQYEQYFTNVDNHCRCGM